jgi:hypothetical protein
MAEEPKDENQIKKDKAYWEARQNLFGFFQLLLEVDKRIDPEFYENLKIKKDKKDDR